MTMPWMNPASFVCDAAATNVDADDDHNGNATHVDVDDEPDANGEYDGVILIHGESFRSMVPGSMATIVRCGLRVNFACRRLGGHVQLTNADDFDGDSDVSNGNLLQSG